MGDRNINSYRTEIRRMYEEEKGGEMAIYLSDLTRNNIREACLHKFSEGCQGDDIKTARRFFRFEDGKDQLKEIERFELDRFRPIENFLKKNSKIKSPSLELIAWLIDFQPRPFRNYMQSKDEGKSTGSTKPKVKVVLENKKDTTKPVDDSKKNGKKTLTLSFALKVIITFGATLICTIFLINYFQNNISADVLEQCMAWAEDHYEEVPCAQSLHPTYKTEVIPFNNKLATYLKKVKVNPAMTFFSESTREPLFWYYKDKNKIEFYTAPGLHPINGRTLKPVTEYIIQKYVPFHKQGTVFPVENLQESLLNASFLNTPDEKELALFIFNGDSLDLRVARHLSQTEFNSYRTSIHLILQSELNTKLRGYLLSGNTSVFGNTLSKHVDIIVTGKITYSFRESTLKPKRTVCYLELSYQGFTATGEPLKDITYIKTNTGTGYSRGEAKNNAIKKIHHAN